MKYINLYITKTQYEADNRPTPSVNYIEEEEVKYEPKPDLISFTVASTVYQAEEGMTWGEFINSNYNQGDFTIDQYSGYIVYKDGKFVAAPNTIETGIEQDEQIIKNQNYETGRFPV